MCSETIMTNSSKRLPHQVPPVYSSDYGARQPGIYPQMQETALSGQRWTASALLFDMDGTLVDSTAAVERVWTRFSRRHGLDVASILAVSHGCRAQDMVTRCLPAGVDPVAEIARFNAEEMQERDGIVAIAGATELLARLPPDRWAIVTSADRQLARLRLQLAGLPEPDVLITAEDVAVGKPSPEGYLLAARRLGVAAHNAVVFEDAPAGLSAGSAAGARLVALATTFDVSRLDADIYLNNYHGLKVDTAANLHRGASAAGSLHLTFTAKQETAACV
jgi:HAD superfamily hydrolase (TIGR01509 family)